MARFRSSIFSFDTVDARGWRLPKGAIGAIAIVLACEVLLHVAAPRLPAPVLWGSTEVSAKVAQVERMAREHQAPVDVLVLGPSHASVGVSPADMVRSHASGLRVYNGALNGRTYPALEFVYQEVYEPLLRPQTLVITVSPLVLNGHNQWMERNSQQLFESVYPYALRANGLDGVWRRFLVNHVYLYRYRVRQRGLEEGWVSRRRKLDQFGWAPSPGVYSPSPGGLPAAHPYRSIMHAYDFSGPSVDAFVRMLDQARTNHKRVVVVNMPFRREMLQISATGTNDYDTYLERMRELQSRFGFVWFDYQNSIPFGDGEFRDVDHLNPLGARKLSERLAEDLERVVAHSTSSTDATTNRPATP